MFSILLLLSLVSNPINLEAAEPTNSANLIELLRSLITESDIGGYIFIQASYKLPDSNDPQSAACLITQLPNDNQVFRDSVILELNKLLHPELYSYICCVYTMSVDFWLFKLDAIEEIPNIVFSLNDPYVTLLSSNIPCFAALEQLSIKQLDYMLFDSTSQPLRLHTGGRIPGKKKWYIPDPHN